MQTLTRDDLMPLETYAEKRSSFRAQVMAHKKNRQVPVGEHATLYFEDRTTIQYQIQEMLRVERIFERDGIQEELDAYNPLIPDGSNLKATFMLEYEDPAQRQRELSRLIGIERQVWVRAGGHERVYAIADEDLDRETEDKTSSVHFLRFELSAAMLADLKAGAPLAVGIDHPHYQRTVEVLPEATRDALVADLD
jgi:hypothetical protein